MKESFKRLIPLSLLILFILPFSVFLNAEESASLEILQAARQGICDFVRAERNSGFSMAQNSRVLAVENGEITNGFQVYTVSPAQLMSNARMEKNLIPTNVWRFVVTKENQAISLVTVAQVDGQWRAVALGGAQLAEEVQKVMNAWPASEGYHIQFIRIFQARTDLMQVSKDGKVLGFVPMAAARMAFKIGGSFNASLLLQAGEIQKPLRLLVENEMKELEQVN